MGQCNQCGKCCLKAKRLKIKEEDLKRWKQGLPLLTTKSMLAEFDKFGSQPQIRSYLTDANTTGHKPMKGKCPFLCKKDKEKYECLLYPYRPQVCRDFKAGSKHAKEFCNCPV